MRVFKNAWFQRFSQREKITNKDLTVAIKNVEKGLIDANYGGYIIKQRIARVGEGKSSGYRAIIVFQKENKSFFVYGFPKKDRDNIDKKEEKTFKKAAKQLLSLSDKQIDLLIEKGALEEISYEK